MIGVVKVGESHGTTFRSIIQSAPGQHKIPDINKKTQTGKEKAQLLSYYNPNKLY